MKKNLLAFLIVIGINLHAQITQETSYPNGNCTKDFLEIVKLSSSGYKYVMKNITNITLYNINHTVFMTIPTPTVGTLSCPSCGLNIWYVSEELFDTNPSTLEYMWQYTDAGGTGHIKVYNNLGSILFSEDSVLTPGPGPGFDNSHNPIMFTSAGTKMIMYKQNATQIARVYALPGTIPCNDCTNGTTTSLQTITGNSQDGKLANYPNPSKDQTTIEYELPSSSNNGEIVFYNITGAEVKHFKVTNAFRNILISVDDLESGTYYYQLQTSDGFRAGKKMVVIK